MKAVGDGFSKPRPASEELPIDINYAKLADWLLDRQKIKTEWRNSLRLIQDKVGAAVENLPDNPALNAVKTGINVKEMNYMTCKKIRDVMTSEKDTAQKNWLGQYKNQATKDWEAILALYHKDNVHLAEAAQIMTQNVQFEIPAIRKLLQQTVKQQQELHRKEGEYKKGAEDYRQRYKQECDKLGIEGQAVKQELLKRSEALPQLYLEMIGELKQESLLKAVKLYAAFVAHVTEQAENEVGPEKALPVLSQLQSEATPSAEQMESIAFAQDAVTLEDMQSIVTGGGDGGGGADIDWGDLSAPAAADDGGIDWGGMEVGGGGGGGDDGIDWGDTVMVEAGGAGDGGGIDWGDEAAAEGGEGAAEIDWGLDGGDDIGISLEEDGAEAIEVVDAVPGEVFKTATGRAKLVDDVTELHTFLRSRLLELDSKEFVAVSNDNAPAALQEESREAVDRLLTAVGKCLSLINASTTSQLIMLRSSRRFRERLVTSLEQRLKNAEKLTACISDCQRKREDLQKQITETQPKLTALIDATRAVQRSTEKIMVEQYKGRRVNIVGDINTVLGES